MSWTPSTLTRAQMQERRLEAARLLRQGKFSQAAIAHALGVSRMAVSHWARQLAGGGKRALRSRPAAGRPPRLTREQRRRLLKVLTQGATAAGFDTERWTLRRVAYVIGREFSVTYHPRYLSRLLKSLGWSVQQPVPQARERDEELVRAWLARDWPRIKKSAQALGRHPVL